jgi:hypothetical protein
MSCRGSDFVARSCPLIAKVISEELNPMRVKKSCLVGSGRPATVISCYQALEARGIRDRVINCGRSLKWVKSGSALYRFNNTKQLWQLARLELDHSLAGIVPRSAITRSWVMSKRCHSQPLTRISVFILAVLHEHRL